MFNAQATSAVISGRMNTEKVGPNSLENITDELKFKEYVRLDALAKLRLCHKTRKPAANTKAA